MRKHLAIFCFLALTLAPAVALAQDHSPQMKLGDERCRKVNAAIDARIRHYDDVKGKHVSAYNNLKARIQKLVDRAAAEGQDVRALKADLVTLDGKIKQFNADYLAYITALKATKNETCGHAEGEFRSGLQQAKDKLKKVKESAADVRNFYKDTIRPKLKELKSSPSPEATPHV